MSRVNLHTVPKQLNLIRPRDLGPSSHGGTTRDGRRKTARPFSPNAAMHIVLKSDRAKGEWSLLRRSNRAKVERVLHVQAARAGVRLYHRAIAGNHVHLLVRISSKQALRRFLRAIAGLIARHVMRDAIRPGRFWSRIPFSRLVHWGREYARVRAYLDKNALEANGFDVEQGLAPSCASLEERSYDSDQSSVAGFGLGGDPGPNFNFG